MSKRKSPWKALNAARKLRKLQEALAPLEAEIKHLKQHRDWLFQTTNRYLERARKAEYKAQQLEENVQWLVRQAKNQELTLEERISIIANYPA